MLSCPTFIVHDRILGAVDGSVVKDTSLVEWSEVIPFAPFNTENNVSSYLQWTIPLTGLAVSIFVSILNIPELMSTLSSRIGQRLGHRTSSNLPFRNYEPLPRSP